ncbi:hypothetical protein SCP_0806140 [Sparassis crispa]|uniref:Uncharacterized protein n=1 Tax=Sparassis crispa TaxID=139825 RepID=A0A401GV76_9APHY|nr:hypothetical protein SCP_0806140 [Sparassis crispa]GBE86090.1 hypothetical protein SCP_0806140 [Sparassis crispa]
MAEVIRAPFVIASVASFHPNIPTPLVTKLSLDLEVPRDSEITPVTVKRAEDIVRVLKSTRDHEESITEDVVQTAKDQVHTLRDITSQSKFRDITGVDARLDRIDVRLDTMEGRLNSVETRLNSMETRLDSMETRLGSMETRLDSMEIRLDSVETRLASMEGRLVSLDQKVAQAHTESQHQMKTITDTLARMEARLGLLPQIGARQDNFAIMSRNERQLRTNTGSVRYAAPQKVIVGDGLELAQGLVRGNVAIPDVPVGEVGSVLSAMIDTSELDHAKILRLIRFYNQDFGIQATDVLATRVQKIANYVTGFNNV